MYKKLLMLLAVLALSACLLAGCGKDKKDDSESATMPGRSV